MTGWRFEMLAAAAAAALLLAPVAMAQDDAEMDAESCTAACVDTENSCYEACESAADLDSCENRCRAAADGCIASCG